MCTFLLQPCTKSVFSYPEGRIFDTANETERSSKEQKHLSDRKPYAHSKCSICSYVGICKPEFEAKQELTLIYGVDSRNAPYLEAQGITTIRQLADADPEAISDVPHLKGARNKLKAVLQAKSYLTHETYRIGDIQLPAGTWVHFDIEDNPLNDSGDDHVYLWGLLKPPYGWPGFQYVWTDGHEQDQAGWLAFLDAVAQLRVEYPDLVICHFSPHEVTKIKRYAKRYAMEDHPIVAWLLGENSPLFDIKKPIMDALVLPLMGYGLKAICKHEGLVNFQWSDDESGSQWSIVQYVNYLIEPLKDRREQMKTVMRHAGPHMLCRHPILSLRHWLDGFRKAPALNSEAAHAGNFLNPTT